MGGKMLVSLAENGQFDERHLRPSGRRRLVGIIIPEIAAAHCIGFGQAIAKRRLGLGKRPTQPFDMGHRPWRPACGDVGQGRKVVIVAVGVIHQLELIVGTPTK
jgi:hypothetical protein